LGLLVVNTMLDQNIHNLCITGGEPFMQPPTELEAFVRYVNRLTHTTIDVFTNGTFLFPAWCAASNVAVVMDWKLTGSGDSKKNQDERLMNATHRLGHKDNIKFVVKDIHDLDEARYAYEMLHTFQGTFWVGRVWGELSDADLVEYMTEWRLPWRLNVQTHKLIWPGVERGI